MPTVRVNLRTKYNTVTQSLKSISKALTFRNMPFTNTAEKVYRIKAEPFDISQSTANYALPIIPRKYSLISPHRPPLDIIYVCKQTLQLISKKL